MNTISDYRPEQQIEALDNAIYKDGISIVRGCVSGKMAEFLLNSLDFDSDYVVDASKSIDRLRDIEPIIKILYTPENIALGMLTNYVAIKQPEFRSCDSEKAHIDDKSSDKGISLLIPVEGEEAMFVASSRPFEMNSDMFNDEWFMELPEMMGVYGVGDLLIMRQNIYSVNGIKVDLNQLYHAGASNTGRKIVSLDFVFSELIL